MEFKLHDKGSAPEASEPVLEKAEKQYGFALKTSRNDSNHLADAPLDEAFHGKV